MAQKNIVSLIAGFLSVVTTIAAMPATIETKAKDYATFNRTTPKKGRIIFVSGSCSSGKSSMAHILAKQLNAKSYAFDEYVMPLVLKKFIRKHYGRVVAFFVNKWVTRNFFSTISLLSEKRKYAMQLKFYNDLKQGMAIEPTSRMYREAKQWADKGHDVVVESPLFLWDGVDCLSSLPEFAGSNITFVLAYCPWADVVERIKQRNAGPNKRNHRELDWVLINYMHTFDVSPYDQGKQCLEQVMGSSVHEVVAKYSQPTYKKQRMCLLKETQIMAAKTFPKDDAYFIYPRFNYNLTVNTKQHTPEQAALLVQDYLMQQEILR